MKENNMPAKEWLKRYGQDFKYKTEIKLILNDLEPYRRNFGKTFEYLWQNLMDDKKPKTYGIDDNADATNTFFRKNGILKVEQKYEEGSYVKDYSCYVALRAELYQTVRRDETYIVLYHLLDSEINKNDSSEPYSYDPNDVQQVYYANLIAEQRAKNNKHTSEWWKNVEIQAEIAIEKEQEQFKTNKSETKDEKIFAGYLHHDNKEALMAKLHELLDKQTSGREIAKVLEALQAKNYLLKQSYNVSDVISQFELNCSRQSITNYLNKELIPQNEITQIIEILP